MYCSRQNVVVAASLVVVILCVNRVYGASSQRTNDDKKANCELVRPFFEMRNISYVLQQDEKYGPVCNGKCCSHSTEADLRHQVQRDFSSLLRHNSQSLQGLLDTTASTLQDHVTGLTRQSENKTLVLFAQVYRRMAVLSQEPISALYADVRRYIQVNGSEDSFTTTLNIDVKESVVQFFVELFPLVYHHNINTQHSRDFTPDYKVCLRETIQEVQPFGDIPRQISQSLAKSLEATRLLLQAFTVGVEVLNTTETLLKDGSNDKNCHEALLKMSYCPKCLGLHEEAKPCSGYCLNVLRGCLTRHVTELDSAWNGYVEAIERLVIAWKQHNNEAGVNADAVIRALDTRISEAIMYAMENTPELEKRVKKACGLPKLSDKEDNYKTTTDASAGSSGKTAKPQRMNVSMRDNPPPETQLLHFLTSIAKSRGFYTTLADNLCKDDSFAETKDQNCWNGQRIGEYTKTVVDTGLGMQKYNPELKIVSEVQNGDPKIANLADKLRHVHNMVITSLGSVNLPEADSYMQDAAADGSGSGQGGRWQDEEDDEVRGSGSGNGPNREEEPIMPDIKGRSSTPKAVETESIASGNALVATVSTTLIITVAHVYRCFG